MSSKCHVCNHSLGEKDQKEVTTECQHTFHYECAKTRVIKDKKSYCPQCKRQSALSDALNRFDKKLADGTDRRNKKPSKDDDVHGDGWICKKCTGNNPATTKFCGHCGQGRSSDSTSAGASKDAARPQDDDKKDGWECSSCSYANDSSSRACTNCKKVPDSRISSSESSGGAGSIIRDLALKSPLIKDPSASPHVLKTDLCVYITDIPPDLDDDAQLEIELRQRLEKVFHINPVDIKCYSSLGAGIIWLADKKSRDTLIEAGIKLTVGPKNQNRTISFSETFELMSYIVIETESSDKKALSLPSAREMNQRWVEMYPTDQITVCEQLNSEFPNIYRIVSTSFTTLVDTIHHPDFKVKTNFARIYAGADCHFLEDVPKTMTNEQLQKMILQSIPTSRVTSQMIHIQVNQTTSCACIIVMSTARLWSNQTSMTIDGKKLAVKENLSFYLLIHPVPQSFKIDKILDHDDFRGKVSQHGHSGDELILSTSDKNLYDDCIKRGVVRIEGKHLFQVKPYIAGKKSENNEIDEETWYNTEMMKHKPDIMQFVVNPKHDIFRYRWNAKIWLEQFNSTNKLKSNGVRFQMPCTQRGDMGDILRHRLQVTVMLNTLAAIRNNGYHVSSREVKLRLNKNPKTIVYNHDSVLENSGPMRLSKTPYDSTKVSVVNDDCVAVYEQLQKRGKHPLLLNMASATSPGGGYRKGDGAQEENLFRRSDYFRSLDVGLDIFLNETPDRLLCTRDGKEKPIPSGFRMYPMDEFGAIYTSDLTFFRHSQDVGYEYMETPLENVCAIAMAAYRDPKLNEKFLDPKYAAGTRKKIENIFSIAYRNGHDSLVLSALGCGAFHNPPHHVAKLFESVIEQYAGFFESVVFAIVDDHNSGHKLNPDGNFAPFDELLNRKTIYPVNSFNKPNTIVGPYQILSDGTKFKAVCIYDGIPCKYAAKCRDLRDEKHTGEFSHPTVCIQIATNGKCESIKDYVHAASFIHRNQCQYGAECRQIDDEKHNRECEHPSWCSKGGQCQDMDKDHLKQYRHLPPCKDGLTCLEYQKHGKKHCDAFRHCKPECPLGAHCANFHNKMHMAATGHPFQTPCPRTPYHCPHYTAFSEASDKKTVSSEVQHHCLAFSHVCRYGRDCSDTSELHWEKSIHIARHICREGDKCSKLSQENHLNSYSHPNIHDFRRLCHHGEKCRDRQKLDHIIKFRHAIVYEDSGIVRYDDLNKGINFLRNQNESIARVLKYIQADGWKTLPLNSIPHDIMHWVRTVQPVHRCNQVIFESILLHGHVMSRDYMENLKKPMFVAHSVMQHSRVRRIENLHVSTIEKNAKSYVIALVSSEFEKHGLFIPASLKGVTDAMGPEFVSFADTVKTKEKYLLDTIGKDVQVLKMKALEIAQASIKLHENPAGIGHAPDKALGTDKHVFSILGPHLGHYYGDIILVFKRDILHHPDSDFSIQAATSYASGNCYKWRPWLGADPGSVDEHVKLYHRSKLHASIPGYDYATALELMAITSHDLKLKSMDIDLSKIFQRWLTHDSHQNIEAHLPPLIPLDYIDHIYIPKNLYAGLSPNARKSVDAVFKGSITETPHDGLAQQPLGPFGPKPDGTERVNHQKYVIDNLMKKYTADAKYNMMPIFLGAVITLPAADFSEIIALPLTFSQAYQHYIDEHKKPPSDDTVYVYWEAMHGDMMVALSSERIDSNDQQPDLCLICYVAPKNQTDNTDYYEPATYLNVGKPNQHHICMSKGKYLAKSNTFHIACNRDDFVIYCLEIRRSTGEVRLRHAGSNGIYNHEEISCNVSKTGLDLKKLEFIQLGAGAHVVPVRNLMVYFERQTHLHPTFDKSFKAKKSPSIDSKDDDSDKKHHRASSAHDDGKKKAVASSDLQPCPDNVNCLDQNGPNSDKHNAKYSHPCRFSELCRNKEPHLTHDPHPSPSCHDESKCNKLTDPFHRAQYRHKDLPDFLIPCREQKKCHDNSRAHRMKYSHGEDVFKKDSSASKSKDAKPDGKSKDDDHRTPCKWGAKCKTMDDADHKAKYSHPKS